MLLCFIHKFINKIFFVYNGLFLPSSKFPIDNQAPFHIFFVRYSVSHSIIQNLSKWIERANSP